ncbi:hypothetical protein [Plebeiibacterium sediminum]|uniref:Uncharacterized protein n=1 Tax=Plebeiibacterium sediminum TaxID=2992112 RepID=A0AAE3MA41_9BACT|nr:hypothetical protein [Plebeiobacterium sediminum]MCW3789772.1 hypothetical protein [Plebeiobacterium sediminum]
MEIVNNEKYEELAAEWQYQMICILKDTLKKHKVDSKKAKEICGDFSFDLAMLQDQGEIRIEQEEYRPVICFENTEEKLMYNSDDDFQLHDYAFGNTDQAFGD